MAKHVIEILQFRIPSLSKQPFFAFRIEGEEEISCPFRFRIEFLAEDPELSLSDTAGQVATLEIGRQDEVRQIHGIIASFSQGPATERGQYIYTAELVPRLTRLAQSRQNQIHGTNEDLSVDEVIRAELTADALKGPKTTVAGRLASSDFDLRLTRSYPKRDYIVQYDETDLDFISRLAENAGIFYFFEQESGKDVAVFGDSRTAFAPSEGKATLPYQRTSGLVPVGSAAIREFSSTATPLPAKVILRDYNYRLPHVSLTAEAAVDPNGHGVRVSYGEHFRTPDEGQQLAQTRAEEILCHGQTYEGRSDCIWLSAGHLFQLKDHFRSTFNRKYCVVRVVHHATMALPGIADIVGGKFETDYHNHFSAIRKKTEFRPRRRTTKPTIHGLSNGLVDAEGSGNRAEIDDQGRYKIRQAFDLREEADGKASLYVRKAEPYGGASSGMHFPLLKNTEVIMAYVNGDPDRPIIVGAVPNPRSKSVVTSKNQTSNMLKTTSGATIAVNDGNSVGGSRSGGSAGNGAALAPVRALEGGLAVNPTRTETGIPETDLILSRTEAAVTDSADSDSNQLYILVPQSQKTTGDSYLRLGNNDSVNGYDESGYVSGSTVVSQEDGILMYTADKLNIAIGSDANVYVSGSVTEDFDGARTTTIGADSITSGVTSDDLTIHGDRNTSITGNVTEVIDGTKNSTITGTHYTAYQEDSTTEYLGSTTIKKSEKESSYNYGDYVSIYTGMYMSISVDLHYKVYIGLGLEAYISLIVKLYLYSVISIYGPFCVEVKLYLSSLNKMEYYAGLVAKVVTGIELKTNDVKIGVGGMLLRSLGMGIGTTSVAVASKEVEVEQKVFNVKVEEIDLTA